MPLLRQFVDGGGTEEREIGALAAVDALEDDLSRVSAYRHPVARRLLELRDELVEHGTGTSAREHPDLARAGNSARGSGRRSSCVVARNEIERGAGAFFRIACGDV